MLENSPALRQPFQDEKTDHGDTLSRVRSDQSLAKQACLPAVSSAGGTRSGELPNLNQYKKVKP